MAKKNQTRIDYPLARDENVVVESVGDETVIYDLDTHVAHALKPLAAAVYLYADGKNTVAEIAELASYRLATTVTEPDAEDALAQLEAISMLSSPVLDVQTGVSRRTALKTFAAAGAGSMLVLSVATSAASACYVCTSAPGASGTNPGGSSGNIACTANTLPANPKFGDAAGPGDCQLCQTSAICGSGTVCCCTPCDNQAKGANGAAYCCQPVCFYGSTCPAWTLPLTHQAGSILCPTGYYQYTGNPDASGTKCCALGSSPFCKTEKSGVCCS